MLPTEFLRELTFKVFWSEEDQRWVATVEHPALDLSGLSALDRHPRTALMELETPLEMAYDTLKEDGIIQ
jgi:hypothetical protein